MNVAHYSNEELQATLEQVADLQATMTPFEREIAVECRRACIAELARRNPQPNGSLQAMQSKEST